MDINVPFSSTKTAGRQIPLNFNSQFVSPWRQTKFALYFLVRSDPRKGVELPRRSALSWVKLAQVQVIFWDFKPNALTVSDDSAVLCGN